MELWTQLRVFLEQNAWNFMWSAVTVFLILFIYKSLNTLIQRRGSQLNLEPHVRNVLRLLLRVVAIIAATTMVFNVWGISTDLFLGGGALVGAALGFGSSQTINNIVAGFYVLVSQPFKVKDFVKIGDLEGQVEEISINHTLLYTPSFNMLKVPNTQVVNSRVLNMTHEGYIKYTFTIRFGHDLTEEQVSSQVIAPGIMDFKASCGFEELRSPEFYLEAADRLDKRYLIRLFIPKGRAKDLYVQQPELVKHIMRRYDEVKKAA